MNFLNRFLTWLQGGVRKVLGISAVVDDSPGWGALNAHTHDRDYSEVVKLYGDALEAWRKNPYAKRIIAIISDYILGDELIITSKHRHMKRFINAFWNHSENRMELRLEAMSDELSRAGDLFPVLFLQEDTGLSLLRFVVKDKISEIRTAENDWESELAYVEPRLEGDKTWFSPKADESALRREENGSLSGEKAVMLHYSINKPLGALTGEGDLNAAIPWLQRYSRMLEDRIRLHMAARVFLWFVTVPAAKVADKRAQYANPPEPGTVIIKDKDEEWGMETPNLQARDASADLGAIRQMIRANDGFPPHWSGESGSSTLAEARAMQAAPERHLARRQRYFVWMLQDILFQAYQRGVAAGLWQPLGTNDYKQLFVVKLPDISREDNANLAVAAKDLASALASVSAYLPGKSKSFARSLLDLVYKFAGETLPDEEKEKILNEAWTNPLPSRPVGSNGNSARDGSDPISKPAPARANGNR